MPDSPKRLVVAKGHCPTCQSPVSVEVEEPAPLVQTVTQPCKCGLTENARAVRYVVIGVIGLGICLSGSCITNQYFTTQQIRSMTEKYHIRRATVDDKHWVNESDYVVEQKPEPPKDLKK